jgi:polysaccharide deacetylase 2 family uncharacterized protein YibQ
MLDELNRPLGLDQKQPTPPGGRKRLWLAGAALVAIVAGGVVWLSGQSGPGGGLGGEPEARAPIQPLPPASPSSQQALALPQALAPGAAQPVQVPAANPAESGQQVDIENGVRVVRGGSGGSGIIHVPDFSAAPLKPAPDGQLIEKSRFGLLPRRGRDGATPAQAYARPRPAVKAGAPRIAIVVGGMGINDSATQAAISRLPAEVSLAFAPYGARVEHLSASARDAGHEILLQTPMEPFDAAESPGPHVLAAGDPPKAEDDLHWQMGRFVGYIGLINFLGGKFTADRDAVAALMTDLSARGLDYIDDGSSPQSLAGDAATEKNVRFLRADVRIDEVARPEAIDAALLKLESLARQNGVAVGFASGLPATSERIVGFLGDLGRRGVVLVPVSTAFPAGDKKLGDKR